MKIFISLPMRGRSNEEIGKDISRVEKFLIKKLREVLPSVNADHDLVFIHNLGCPKPEVKNESVGYLANAIHELANCDALVRLFPATNYRRYYAGCEIEQRIADDYGIPVIQIVEDRTHELRMQDIYFKAQRRRYDVPVYHDEDDCSF